MLSGEKAMTVRVVRTRDGHGFGLDWVGAILHESAGVSLEKG